MYTRFGNTYGFKVEVLDYQAGDEANQITCDPYPLKGHMYGLLKSQNENLHHVGSESLHLTPLSVVIPPYIC